MLFYSYLHNSIGKRNSFGKNGATTLYAANELNQYTNALAGGRAPTYDPDGNMTSDGEHHFTWDAENRLVGVSPRVLITGSRTYSYEYDHMGRRVKKAEKRHTMAESDFPNIVAALRSGTEREEGFEGLAPGRRLENRRKGSRRWTRPSGTRGEGAMPGRQGIPGGWLRA